MHVKAGRCNYDIDPVYINQFDRPARPLDVVDSCTVLGLEFDKHLKFKKQVTSKVDKAKVTQSMLYRFRNMSVKTKHHLFQALLKPHLTYAPLALLSTAPTNRKLLQI